MISQEQFRQQFDVNRHRLYFNHAAYAPMSRSVVRAMSDYFQVRLEGEPNAWGYVVERYEGLRSNFASLVNAEPDRVAIVANTVVGINVLATGLDWQAGDRIILYEKEFPANVLPFTNLKGSGVEVDFISDREGRVDVQLFEAALTSRTRLVSISSVQWLTGYRADLKALSELCHARGILLCVDGIQSVGAIPMDVDHSGIDMLVAGGHKWQMSPLGTGLLYLTEELQERLKMGAMGYMGKVDPEDYLNFNQPLSPHARRYEMGAFPAPSIIGAQIATKLLLEAGIENIQSHLRALLHQFRKGLTDIPYRCRYEFDDHESAGILIFGHQDSRRNPEVYDKMVAAGVNLSLRDGWLRLSPHYFINADDVSKLLDILEGIR